MHTAMILLISLIKLEIALAWPKINFVRGNTILIENFYLLVDLFNSIMGVKFISIIAHDILNVKSM